MATEIKGEDIKTEKNIAPTTNASETNSKKSSHEVNGSDEQDSLTHPVRMLRPRRKPIRILDEVVDDGCILPEPADMSRRRHRSGSRRRSRSRSRSRRRSRRRR